MEIIRTNDVKLTAQAVWGPSDPIRAAAGWKRHDGFLEPKPLSTWISTWIQDVEWMQIVICRCDRWDRRRYMDPAWLRVVPSMPEAIPIDYIPGTPTPCMARAGTKYCNTTEQSGGIEIVVNGGGPALPIDCTAGLKCLFLTCWCKSSTVIYLLFSNLFCWHDLPWQASGLGDGLCWMVNHWW